MQYLKVLLVSSYRMADKNHAATEILDLKEITNGSSREKAITRCIPLVG